jgi:hypothetical protein
MTRPTPASRTLVAVLVAAAFLTVAAPAAEAQKRRPKPIDTRPKGPDIEGFAEAYERANEPEMIVMVGIVTGGRRSGERDVAAFDPEADSDALRRRIEENLLEARVELIEQSSLDAVRRRELTLLGQQGEGEVIEALKEKFNADVAIKIEMQPRGGDSKYRVTVDTLSVTRGRKLGTFSFDWVLNDDARSVKEYGDAVSRKVMEQFVKFYGPGDRGGAEMRYTVLLVGIEDNRAVRDVSRAIERIGGVNKVRVRGNTDAGGRKATSLEVRYTGQMFDLATDIEEAAGELLGLRMDGTDSNSGTITLIAKGTKPAPPPPPSNPCEELFNPSAQRHQLFAAQYKTQGRPRVTILINREVFKGERQNQEHADNFKFIGPPPGGTTHPLLVTATAENAIADWFKKLGVRVVNADQVRQRVKQAADKAGGVFKDDELAQLLKDNDLADIVILGRGGTVGNGGVWYTFEATRIGGDNLGNTRWTAEIDGRNLAAVNEAFEELGHDVTCKLALDMMSEWSGNSRLDVVVTGVRNANGVHALMDQLKRGFDGIKEAEFVDIDGGRAGGTARFAIEYTSTYEDLARRIAELAEDGGFTVESSTREGLFLRVGGAPAAGDAPDDEAAAPRPAAAPKPKTKAKAAARKPAVAAATEEEPAVEVEPAEPTADADAEAEAAPEAESEPLAAETAEAEPEAEAAPEAEAEAEAEPAEPEAAPEAEAEPLAAEPAEAEAEGAPAEEAEEAPAADDAEGAEPDAAAAER